MHWLINNHSRKSHELKYGNIFTLFNLLQTQSKINRGIKHLPFFSLSSCANVVTQDMFTRCFITCGLEEFFGLNITAQIIGLLVLPIYSACLLLICYFKKL